MRSGCRLRTTPWIWLALSLASSSAALGQDGVFYEPAAGERNTASEHARLADLRPAEAFDRGLRRNVSFCNGALCGECVSEGMFFSAELGFIGVAQSSSNNLPARLLQFHSPAAPALGSRGFDPDPTPRLVAGFLTCEGLGVRTRFWDYGSSESASLTPAGPAGATGVTHGLEATVFDVEVVKAIANPVWNAMFSGGYRLALYKEQATVLGPNPLSVDAKYLGNGFTTAVDLRRRLTTCCSLFASPRASLLLGSQSVTPPTPPFPQSSLNSGFDARYVLETQLGVSYELRVGEGVWFARGGYEVQYWDDFVAGIGAQSDLSWTMFHGCFVAVGLQR